jgi:hypothetical protein
MRELPPNGKPLSPRIAMNLNSVRRALGDRGLTPVSVTPELRKRYSAESLTGSVRLVEGSRLEAIPVGPGQTCPEPLAFLNGVQHAEIVAYAGVSPILVAEIAAAVRERRERRLHTALEERRRIALGRPAALDRAGSALDAFELVPLPGDDPPHPIRDLMLAAQALDQSRRGLELALGNRYCPPCSGWLIVDGALAEYGRWARDTRLIAISKSHALPSFQGEDLERYLRLPAGYRSSIYEPAVETSAPIRGWGLRLRTWDGKDLLYALVRVEVAPERGSPEMAGQISRWILAERSPVSAPDRDWDRVLYGSQSVEQYLRSKT